MANADETTADQTTWDELGATLRIREPATYQLVKALITASVQGDTESLLVRYADLYRWLEARAPAVLVSLVELGEQLAAAVSTANAARESTS